MIPISPTSTGGIRNYLGARLNRDDKPEAMCDDPWGDGLWIISEYISNLTYV